MTTHAKHTQPAKGSLPTSGWAPNYGFLLESNQRGLCTLVPGGECAVAGNRAVHPEPLAGRHGGLVDVRELQQPRGRLRMPAALRRKDNGGIHDGGH